VLNTLSGHLDMEGGMLFAKAAAFASNTVGNPETSRAKARA